MNDWKSLRVLCLGGAGQTGREICRRLGENGAATVIVHDLRRAGSERAIEEIRAQLRKESPTEFVASAGDVFCPDGLGGWEFVPGSGSCERVCRETGATPRADRTDVLDRLIESRLGSFDREAVKRSMIWHLVDAYRPHVVVDAINTATVLGYAGDLISAGRDIGALARRIVGALQQDQTSPLALRDLPERLAALEGDAAAAATRDLAALLETSLSMTAHLDTACMIRFVQCLHAIFAGDEATRVPGFMRYVKVHTSGLGGMGFNIRYTHGDTGEPGLSTKLLGKVCAAGSLTQLLLSLAHTPGCDVRVVVPAALVGWTEAEDAIVRGRDGAAIPMIDTDRWIECDGATSLGEALASAPKRIEKTGRPLEIPSLQSGENRPYAIEDITAVTALGQMGCVTKEEVARATLDCIAGDSRYDLLAAIDAAMLLPTQTAAVERDRLLGRCGRREAATGFRLPSVSTGNLGPTIAKHLYEIEIIRAAFETVTRVADGSDPTKMALRACAYILEDKEGAVLRRQILSLGIPVFFAKGPGRCGLLLGDHLGFPNPCDADALARPLDPNDKQIRAWLDQGWIDLSGTRMHWWHRRFVEVKRALENDRAVSRDWFSPDEPFSAGQFLGYLYSISGGQRKQYM